VLRLGDMLTACYVLSMRALERAFSSPIQGEINARETCSRLKAMNLTTRELSKNGKSNGDDTAHDAENSEELPENNGDHPKKNPWMKKEKFVRDPWMMDPLEELSGRLISRMSHHRLAAYVQSLPEEKRSSSIEIPIPNLTDQQQVETQHNVAQVAET
jgi:hypothetical protein